MKKYTKYAVVIVTYNREQLLRECVYSIQSQTIPAESIIIVNNASTDGTTVYLKQLSSESNIYEIIDSRENIGGAGGFARGIEAASRKDVDCILIIDDDAMPESHYMEQLLAARQRHPEYKAFAGTVKVNGSIDTFHRKKLSKYGMLLRNCPQGEYQKEYFECDIASFCGMLVDVAIIKKIGYPHAEYFIWHDDAEYSLRIIKHSRFLVVPQAILDHKTKPKQEVYPRRYDRRDYYAVRNMILMVKEHGTFIDKVINYTHMFVHVVFRNWLFSVVRCDGYDWKYERELVKKAIRDANGNRIWNNITERDSYNGS